MNRIYLFIGILFLFVFIALSLSPEGPQWATLLEFFSGRLDSEQGYILAELRFPRAMASIFVGASLGLAGALLQTILQNSLAEPYTLGLSGGSTLGVVIAILLEISPEWLMIPTFAFVGCLLTTLLIFSIAKKGNLYGMRSLILTGVMISLFSGSFVILLMSWLKPFQLQTMFIWMMGQVGTERDQWWPLAAAVLFAGMIWSYLNNEHLDRFLLGEDMAITLGSNTQKIKKQVIILVTVLCSVTVAVAGLVGFVGLLAPHLSLLLFGTHRHKRHIPLSSLMGAILFLSADVLGRFVGGEREIPAGGLVAIFGAPILIFLLARKDHATSN